MKFSSYIDNVTAKEWGLNIQLAYLFDWIYSLPSWAESLTTSQGTFYFASKTKAIEELPLLTDKLDTMYRHYKALEDAGLIELIKVDSKDFVKLTERAKTWGRQSGTPEKNPMFAGKKSEKGPEKNPTYKNTTSDKNTNDKGGHALETREGLFRAEVSQIILESKAGYSLDMVASFCNYWTEPNQSKKKMRFELQKVFDIKRRLATWANREAGFKPNQNEGRGNTFAVHV